jgi:hypothetical protein
MGLAPAERDFLSTTSIDSLGPVARLETALRAAKAIAETYMVWARFLGCAQRYPLSLLVIRED